VLKKISWILFKLVLLYGVRQCMAQPGIPSVVYPKNQEVLSANSPVLFYWSFGLPQADEFELEISANASFGQITHAAAGLTNNRYTWNAGTTAGAFYWRVRGKKQNIAGAWSPTKSFLLFTPASLPNLQLWLRADTGIVLQGNRISAWHDLSPNQFVLTQADTIRQFKINQTNQILPMAEAFGNQLYELPLFPWQNTNTGFVVGRRTGGLPYGCFFSAPAYNFDIHTNIGVVTNNAAGAAIVGFWNIDTLSVLSIRRIPGNSSAYKNSILSPPAINNPLDPCGPGPLRIGDRFDGITDLTGMFGEMIICNTALSDSIKFLTETYLMNKFDGKVSLPADTITNNSFCPLTISMPAGIYNGQWQNGLQSPTITVSQSQYVSFTGFDLFKREVTDSMFIKFPEPNYPQQLTLCKDSVITWIPFENSTFNIQWNNGNNGDSLVISAPGQYFASITDPGGCNISTDTIIVSADYLSYNADLGVDTNLCSGNPLMLTPLPVNGAQYLWNTGETTDIITADSSATYIVNAFSPAGCYATDTVIITIAGQAPSVDFTFSSGCIGDSIYFTDQSQAPPGSTLSGWQWDFGNSNSSNLQNAAVAYPDTGIYYVNLTVEEQNGCKNFIQKDIRIYKKPQALGYFLNACENSPVPFFEISNSYNGEITQWLWNFDDSASGSSNSSMLQQPQHHFSSEGQFNVSLIVINNAGCADTAILAVNVKSKPMAQISFTGNCPNQAFSVFSNSSAAFPHNIIQNIWNDSLSGPYLNFPASPAGNYPVKLEITSSNGCKDTLSTLVNIAPLPAPDITHSPPCVSKEIRFSDSGNCDSCSHRFYSWKWNSLPLSHTGSDFDTIFTSQQNGEIILTLIDQRGCAGIDTLQLNIENSPQANIIIPEIIFGAPVDLAFSNGGSGGSVSSQWYSNGQTQNGNQASFSYVEAGQQSIMLISASAQGCTDTALTFLDIPRAQSELSLSLKGFSNVADGYLRPNVTIKNLGNIPEKNISLTVLPASSEAYEEILDGILFPGDSAIVNISETFLPQLKNSNVCCVEIKKSGLPAELNLRNNKVCGVIDVTIESMDQPFPNPAGNEVFIRINSVAEKAGVVYLSDLAGRIVRKWDINLKEGLQTIKLETSGISAGAYQISLTPDGKTRRLLINGLKGP
jgi:PKD repeat protein